MPGARTKTVEPRWVVEEWPGANVVAGHHKPSAVSVTIQDGDVVCWMEPTAPKRTQLKHARAIVREHNRAAGYVG